MHINLSLSGRDPRLIGATVTKSAGNMGRVYMLFVEALIGSAAVVGAAAGVLQRLS